MKTFKAHLGDCLEFSDGENSVVGYLVFYDQKKGRVMLSQENSHHLRYHPSIEASHGDWYLLEEYGSYRVLSRADNRKLSPINSPKKTSELIITLLRRSGPLSVEDLEKKLGISSDAAEEGVPDAILLELWNQRRIAYRWDWKVKVVS